MSEREKLEKVICDHTGWQPDWDCTQRLADAIEELPNYMLIDFGLGYQIAVDFADPDVPPSGKFGVFKGRFSGNPFTTKGDDD